VAFAGLLLLGGRLADLLGPRRVLVLGVGVFGLASAGTGVAPGLVSTHEVGPCQGQNSSCLLVLADHAGRSRGQGGAPDWTSDLDAGEDRRRITG